MTQPRARLSYRSGSSELARARDLFVNCASSARGCTSYGFFPVCTAEKGRFMEDDQRRRWTLPTANTYRGFSSVVFECDRISSNQKSVCEKMIGDLVARGAEERVFSTKYDKFLAKGDFFFFLVSLLWWGARSVAVFSMIYSDKSRFRIVGCGEWRSSFWEFFVDEKVSGLLGLNSGTLRSEIKFSLIFFNWSYKVKLILRFLTFINKVTIFENSVCWTLNKTTAT